MNYDPTLPKKLKETQEWFGEIIGRAIEEDQSIQNTTPRGNSIVEEAQEYIDPSPTLEPWQRIEIYNQQYWWRLLGILHENLPLVTRLFGNFDFNNTLGMPYLLKYPPDTWSLNPLGTRFPQWVEEEYFEEDKRFVLDAARVDVAFNDGFVAKQYPLVNNQSFESEDEILETPFSLQPHISLFELEYDIFSFREEMLKEEPDYWHEHEFPKMEHEPTYVIVFRNVYNQMQWDKLPKGEFFLLKQFNVSSTIDDACDKVETLDTEMQSEIAKNLSDWFQSWAIEGWLFPTIDTKR